MEKQFVEVYQELYDFDFSKIEKIRKRTKSRNRIYGIFVVLDLFALLFLITISNNESSYLLIKCILILLFFIVTIIFATKDDAGRVYKNIFKDRILKYMLEECFKDLKYHRQDGVKIENYLMIKNMGPKDEYSSSDLLIGKTKKGISIEMSQVIVGDLSEKRGLKYYGLFVVANINQNKKIKMEIRPNDNMVDCDKLSMDSGEFEKYFDVLAEDKIKAMQVLTSDTMSKIVDYYNKNVIAIVRLKPKDVLFSDVSENVSMFYKMKGHTFSINIIDDKIFVRFYNGETFNVDYNKDLLDINMLKEFYDEVDSALDIVDIMAEALQKSSI